MQERLDKSTAEVRRLQLEKEKQAYDYENLQSQLDKALGQAARMQKEREGLGIDADRMREKLEKTQVLLLLSLLSYLFVLYFQLKLYRCHLLVYRKREMHFRMN